MKIAITPGEPAGIGPDLCIALAHQQQPEGLVFIADPDLLSQRAELLGTPITIIEVEESQPPQPHQMGCLHVLPVYLNAPSQPGQVDTCNAPYVLKTLDKAIAGCLSQNFAALVTGPVHKAIINQNGTPFSGHTEYLAQHSQTKHVVMMLATDDLRVALVTTHIPLAQVSAQITPALLTQTMTILDQGLRSSKAVNRRPRIFVCGLNPHAGEEGYLGTEEIDTIKPVIQRMQEKGLDISGPYPADTVFTSKYINDCDVILTMYHDQGLPVLKHQGFGKAVNITLGLPFIRTSVDHGTALDLAGTGKANAESLRRAINMAQQLAANR